MKKVSDIVFVRDDYKGDEKAMVRRAGEVAAELVELGHNVVMRWDDRGVGVLILEFERNDPEIGYPFPHWLYPEELMQISKEVYEVKYHDIWKEMVEKE